MKQKIAKTIFTFLEGEKTMLTIENNITETEEMFIIGTFGLFPCPYMVIDSFSNYCSSNFKNHVDILNDEALIIYK